MPNPSKTRRVLSMNGQEYIVADSVKSELLMQLLDLFSNELLKLVKEEYLVVMRGESHGYEYVLVEQGAEVKPAGLAVSRREILTRDEYIERDRRGEEARKMRDKALAEAMKRADALSHAGEAVKNGK